ncbi:head GIN domain-containing protein [Flavihumibacter sp. CACIAM 22H1]|uniref:head GIN domain-containing protein n=1 Tax=Flavihumibacter sp. CACIAM 22H1 TaxID=1812911 RepID=UPI0007A903CF|nr:head GIN domain-containing protein [Flavihumibacter sp. CACIAM 22H1]KYP14670.1 MAG: hypothetical protein A1D16_09715 [Flavihumibacter sp. CACIAM 22H1]
MKKIVVGVLLVLTAMAGQAQKYLINDKNAEMRTVPTFTAIDASSAIDVYISQGDESGVAVSSSDKKLTEQIRTEVKDGVLKIWFASQGWKDWRSDRKMKAYISVKDLSMIKASGACDISIMGVLKSNQLNVELNGASDMTGEVDCNELTMNLNGASDIRLKGKVGKLAAKISGASSVKGWDLTADYCELDANGASSINVVVNKEISAKAGGASDIRIKGEGLIKDMKSSGASSITRKS